MRFVAMLMSQQAGSAVTATPPVIVASRTATEAGFKAS
jgi:hypothetical protein